LFHCFDKTVALEGNGSYNRFAGIQQRRHFLNEEPGKTFHFPDLIDDEKISATCFRQGGLDRLVNCRNINAIFADTPVRIDIKMRNNVTFSIKRNKGKPLAAVLRTNFFGIESGYGKTSKRGGNLFDNGGFPDAGSTGQEKNIAKI
jgi:hypothetical protein